MKQKSYLILKAVVDLMRRKKSSMSCKQIVENLRPEINIAYRDMNLYLNKIKPQLKISKIGYEYYYTLDTRKKIVLIEKIVL